MSLPVESAKMLNGPATLDVCRKKGQLLQESSLGTTVTSGMALMAVATERVRSRDLIVNASEFNPDR